MKSITVWCVRFGGNDEVDIIAKDAKDAIAVALKVRNPKGTPLDERCTLDEITKVGVVVQTDG